MYFCTGYLFFISLYTSIVVTLWNSSIVSACDGYSFSNVHLAPCDNNITNKIRVTDYNLELTKDCKLITSGCIEFDKNITWFDIEYEVTKGAITLKNGKLESGCKLLERLSHEYKTMFVNTGLPQKCPVEAAKICGGPEKSVSIVKHKSKLGMLVGKSSGRFTAKSNIGNSCFKFVATLKHNAAQVAKNTLRKFR